MQQMHPFIPPAMFDQKGATKQQQQEQQWNVPSVHQNGQRAEKQVSHLIGVATLMVFRKKIQYFDIWTSSLRLHYDFVFRRSR